MPISNPTASPAPNWSRRRLASSSRPSLGSAKLEIAFEHLLEELALAPRAPELELRIAFRVEPHDHERRPDAHVEIADGAAAAAVETVGKAQQRGKAAEALGIGERELVA